MNRHAWCTKEDVLKDLEVASGRRVADVSDGFFVVGEQPPPPRMFADEDDEIELRFGRNASTQRLDHGNQGPDLNGITKMLRMVQEYENSSDEETRIPARTSPRKKIVISKLNPNVKEFIPKSAQISSSQNVTIGKGNATLTTDTGATTAEVVSNVKNRNLEILVSQDVNSKKDKNETLVSQDINSKKGKNETLVSQDINSKKGKNETLVSQDISSKNGKNETLVSQDVNSKKDKYEILVSQDVFSKSDKNDNFRSQRADRKNEKDILFSQNEKIDAVEILDEEYTKESKKQIAEMLKTKISSKKVSFRERRQTNLAIVNLLKLYAKPEPKTIEPAKPLKLLTPQFFENCKASDYKSNVEDTEITKGSIEHTTLLPRVDEVKNTDVTLVQPRDFIADHRDSIDDAVADNSSAKIINKNKDFNVLNKKNNDSVLKDDNEIDYMNEATSLTPDMADASLGDNIASSVVVEEAVDPDVAESISKVNRWLDDKPYVSLCEKEKPKGPALYLGTVAYKRKDPATCKSPSDVADKKISKPSDTTYIPSSYADELLKKYKERNLKKTPTLNIWEKLEEDLKKKDVEIKNRKKKA